MDDSTKGALAAVLTIVVALAVTPTACEVDDATATRVLAAEGYDDVRLTGFEWFACGQDDGMSTGFVAKRNGLAVEGVVCCGALVKDCTVRH